MRENELKKQEHPILQDENQNSDLVGMYAFYVVNKKIVAKIYIHTKLNEKLYVCQAIDGLGNPNVARLLSLQELSNWYIILTKELAEEMLEDYRRNGWRYSTSYF